MRTGRDPLVKPNKLGARLSPRQQRALLRGLAVHVSPRISSMELLRSRLYNLPLSEEVLWRKRLIRNISVVGAVVVLVGGLFALNATTGLPTFSGVCFTIGKDGISAVRYYLTTTTAIPNLVKAAFLSLLIAAVIVLLLVWIRRGKKHPVPAADESCADTGYDDDPAEALKKEEKS